MFDPKAIEIALFEHLKKALSVQQLAFVAMSRYARMWANTDIANMPAFYLIPLGGLDGQPQAFNVSNHQMRFVALAQWKADDPSPNPDVAPQDFGNDIWKAIVNALIGVPPGEPVTLGGLVQNAWTEGEIVMQPGILDSQCSIEIPITVLTGI